jgi:site-specific recombinase XerD
MDQTNKIVQTGKGETPWNIPSMVSDGIIIQQSGNTIHNNEPVMEDDELNALGAFVTTQVDANKADSMTVADVLNRFRSLGYTDVTNVINVTLAKKGWADGPASNLLAEELILDVCSRFPSDNRRYAFSRMLKELITYAYGADPIILKLDPQYNRLLYIINGKTPSTSAKRKAKIIDHPMIVEYKSYLEEKDSLSATSLIAVNRMLLRWLCNNIEEFQGMKPQEIDVTRINTIHLNTYQKYIKERTEKKEISKATEALYLHGVRKWFDFLLEKRYTTVNPSQLEISWVTARRSPSIPTEGQITEFLLSVVEHSPNVLMELALFYTAVDTGLRSVSLLSAKVGGFNSEAQTLSVVLKGGDEHLQPLHPLVAMMIDRYLETRRIGDRDISAEPLWLNSWNQALQSRPLRDRFHRYWNLAGLPDMHFGAMHIFRHYFFSTMVSIATSSADLDRIVFITGAKSAKEIDPYLHNRESELRRAFLEYYPKLIP